MKSSSIKSARRNRGPSGRGRRAQVPIGRIAEEVVPRDAAALAWMANWRASTASAPVRAEDLDHPDELRVDLDPVPGVEWRQVQDVAKVVHATLDDWDWSAGPDVRFAWHHVNGRIKQQWTFTEVRRAAVALARGSSAGAGDRHQQVVERRASRSIHRLQPEREGRTVCSGFRYDRGPTRASRRR